MSNPAWSIRGVEAKSREEAKILAQKSGQNLGDWMTNTILTNHTLPEAANEKSNTKPTTPYDDRLFNLCNEVLRVENRVEKLLVGAAQKLEKLAIDVARYEKLRKPASKTEESKALDYSQYKSQNKPTVELQTYLHNQANSRPPIFEKKAFTAPPEETKPAKKKANNWFALFSFVGSTLVLALILFIILKVIAPSFNIQLL